jgi:hypothetical protein
VQENKVMGFVDLVEKVSERKGEMKDVRNVRDGKEWKGVGLGIDKANSWGWSGFGGGNGNDLSRLSV